MRGPIQDDTEAVGHSLGSEGKALCPSTLPQLEREPRKGRRKTPLRQSLRTVAQEAQMPLTQQERDEARRCVAVNQYGQRDDLGSRFALSPPVTLLSYHTKRHHCRAEPLESKP